MKPLTRLLDRFSAAFKTPAPVAAPEEPAAAPAVEPLSAECPPRLVEGRREFNGLLWFPVLTVKDDERRVVAARAGLPHCVRCERAMTLASGAREEWACAGCGQKRPGSEVDFFVADSVIAAGLRDFFEGHPGFTAAPGLPVPARAVAA
jgi:hypothetical protein